MRTANPQRPPTAGSYQPRKARRIDALLRACDRPGLADTLKHLAAVHDGQRIADDLNEMCPPRLSGHTPVSRQNISLWLQALRAGLDPTEGSYHA